MSRALDQSVKEALKNADHRKVYEDISSLLATPNSREPLEIEVLASSHPLEDGVSYIQDEEDKKFVAVPKLRIVQAFIVARQLFFTHLNDSKRSRRPATDGILKPTAVMLLMDPEHLTAANARKRCIKDSLAADQEDHTRSLIQQELVFLRSLLTSRLHRHTKSPTLWSHRRWVVDQAKKLKPPLQTSLTLTLKNEIFVSGERHPRNYYAWSHARYLVEADGAMCDTAELTEAVQEIKQWCFKHHDDVSGWMYLLFVLGRLRAVKQDLGRETPEHEAKAAFGETVNLIKSFRWRNESVWYFLRNLITTDSMGTTEKQVFYSVLMDVEKGATTRDAATLSRTRAWTEQWPVSP